MFDRLSVNMPPTSELAAYVGSRVVSGRYRGASKAVRGSLRLLQREEPSDGVAPTQQKAALLAASKRD